jgi:hypothetical protein
MDSCRPAACLDNPCCNPAIPCYHVAVELQYSWSGKMGNEISQFDIPDRQLPAGSAQAGSWSDIGEAKITRTIFGRTKVRVIRKQDKILRAWVLGALAMTVIAVAAWQGWVALQHSKMFAVLPPLSERISVSPPVYQPETTAPAAPRSPGKGRPESVIQAEIDSMLSNPNARPPRPTSANTAEPMDATPASAQPLIAGKPQAAPLATNNGASTTQTTVTQSHSKPPAPAHTAVPAVATHPSAQPASPAVSTPAATHPAASKPAPVAAPAEPSSKKDAPASSAANNQPADPANAQTQVNARGTAIIFVEPKDSAKP